MPVNPSSILPKSADGRIRSLLFGICIACLAVGLAIFLYGELLNPMRTTWLLHENDPLQHFTGWLFFRHEPWHWPLGTICNLASQTGTSIVFTDSIPLLALPLKALQTFLPEHFQYLGLGMALNLILNATAAYWLLRRCSLTPIAAFLTSILILLQPAALMRGLGAHGHTALTAHWVLIFALGLLIFPRKKNSKTGLAWFFLLACAVLIHFYLFFMAGVLWFAWWIRTGLEIRSSNCFQGKSTWVFTGIFTPGMILLIMWGAGYFHHGAAHAGSGGFEIFSAELFTFFNPASKAWFLHPPNHPSLSSLVSGWQTPVWGQYEGQSYMGLGGILLLVAAVFSMWIRPHPEIHTRQSAPDWKWAWIAALFLFAFSLSDRIIIGTYVLDLHYSNLVDPLARLLRSSGRLAWPLLYMLLMASAFSLGRRIPRRILYPMLALFVVLQTIDISPGLRFVHSRTKELAKQLEDRDLPFAVLNDPSMQKPWETHRRIIVVPIEKTGNPHTLRPYLWIAGTHGLAINYAHLAHVDPASAQPSAKEILDLKEGRPRTDTIYVVTSAELALQACGFSTTSCKNFPPLTLVWSNRQKPANGVTHAQ